MWWMPDRPEGRTVEIPRHRECQVVNLALPIASLY